MKEKHAHKEAVNGERIQWMRYSVILGRINLVYEAKLISEEEYHRATDQLRKDYCVISHLST